MFNLEPAFKVSKKCPRGKVSIRFTNESTKSGSQRSAEIIIVLGPHLYWPCTKLACGYTRNFCESKRKPGQIKAFTGLEP